MTAKAKGGALARLAGMWCGNPDFWRFVAHRSGKPCDSAAAARAYVLAVCGIESRAQLDSVPAAEAKFHAGVRLRYMRWMKGAREGGSLEHCSCLGESPANAEAQENPARRDQGDVAPVHGATSGPTQFESVS
ncbi:hypothetical protein Tamer19_17400 [Cupriavidus sp. TA19]|uniref:hypothetical protein n=1 Tax=Cupriavidus sp. TA19 TaxID=701108 RepID=UPI0027293FDA|nr:hypothetical protein [Cupriavidus sp. TA19]GLC92332.1 hypothetical protein Tamer19_17400 [Cupriavidus sp. TA19]